MNLLNYLTRRYVLAIEPGTFCFSGLGVQPNSLASGLAIAWLALFHSLTANASDLGGTANATVSRTLTVNEETPMSFGIIATNAQRDTVTLSPAGILTSGVEPYQFSGSSSPATFTASGIEGTPVTISFSTGDRLTGPGRAMRLNNFQHDAGTTPLLDNTGSLTFNVGADLRVRRNQASGLYSGSYTITVNYQ